MLPPTLLCILLAIVIAFLFSTSAALRYSATSSSPQLAATSAGVLPSVSGPSRAAGDAPCLTRHLAARRQPLLAAQWSGFIEDAEKLSAEESEAIAKRDALIRRVAADNSPDNANREKVFGKAAFARTKALLCGELDACE